MATNTFIRSDFQEFGASRVYVWDTNHSSWQYLGMVEDVQLTTEKDIRKQTHTISDQNVQTASKSVGQDATLSMTVMEDANPATSKLVWGDRTTSQTLTNAYNVNNLAETFPLYDLDEFILKHQRGLLRASNAGVPTLGSPSTNAVAWVAPLTTATSYEMWIAPGYGTNPTANAAAMSAADVAGKDRTWTLGTPIQVTGDPATGANTSIEADVTAFTLAKGPAAPDFWVIIMAADSGTLGTAFFAATQDYGGSFPDTIVIGTLGTVSYAAANYYFIQETLTYGTTPTYTPRTEETDVELDLNTGVVKRKTAGSFTNGGQAHLTYWYFESPNTSDDVGNQGTGEDLRILQLVVMTEDDSSADGEDLREKGIIFILDECNTAAINGSQSFTKDDWHAGEVVDIPINYDRANGRFGTKKLYNPVHENLIIGYD